RRVLVDSAVEAVHAEAADVVDEVIDIVERAGAAQPLVRHHCDKLPVPNVSIGWFQRPLISGPTLDGSGRRLRLVFWRARGRTMATERTVRPAASSGGDVQRRGARCSAFD